MAANKRGCKPDSKAQTASEKEREAGVKDMAADKHKNQQNAQQGGDQGGRLSNKPNAQPIHDDATQDLRSVAAKAQENSVEQPNNAVPAATAKPSDPKSAAAAAAACAASLSTQHRAAG